MSATLQIQLFGGLRVALDGKPIDGFYSIKAPALLAYLAVTRRTPTRDSLAALFWGEMSDVEAKTNLRQCLANLRKLLEPFLRITRDSVEFNFDAPYTLDVEQFETFLRAENLVAAVELFKGDFLDGVFVRDAPDFEEWAIAQRARLRELLLQALHTLVERSARRGAYTRGIDYATRLIALDPWREETHRELMLMLARMGQRSVALEQYQVCQRVLAEGLGVAPSAETTALYERIRAAGDAVRHNLPAQATSFIGRAKELDQIENALRRSECRLVTLHGGGGIGKTRLAIQAAERALKLGAFLNGVYFVPLDSIDSIDLLAPAIAEACGFAFSGKPDPKTQVANFLREKEILLVLDNFEHLLDAATWLGQLLTTAPSLKLLVTSRERLNLKWEWIIVVEGLDYPIDESGKTLAPHASAGVKDESVFSSFIFHAKRSSFASVDLFIARARQAQPDFQIDAAANANIARVCQLVDGIPLGIELAAAWVSTHSMDEIVRELERGYDFLATTQRDAPARQRSLRAVFEYAWNALTPDERAVFSRLAIFRGGFTRAAAEHVAGVSLAILTALVNKSLVRLSATKRYSLHEILLRYAEEKLGETSSEVEQVQIKHCSYWAEFLAERFEQMKDTRQAVAFQEIRADLDNIRAAWQFALVHRRLAEIDRIAPALYLFYEKADLYQEGQYGFESAVQVLESPQDVAGELRLAQMQARWANFAMRLSDYEHAYAVAQTSWQVCERLGKPLEGSIALNVLGNVEMMRGNYHAAMDWYQKRLELERAAGRPYELAVAINNLGNAVVELGDLERGRQLAEEALALRQKIGARDGLASAFDNLGYVHYLQGNLAESKRLRLASIALYKEIGAMFQTARLLNNLASVIWEEHDYSEVKRLQEECYAIASEYGYSVLKYLALSHLSAVAAITGDLLQARQYFHRALCIAKETHSDHVTLSGLAEANTLIESLGEYARGVELGTLIIRHPATRNESKEIVETWVTQFRAKLAPEVAAQAELRGASLTLEQELDELIRWSGNN